MGLRPPTVTTTPAVEGYVNTNFDVIEAVYNELDMLRALAEGAGLASGAGYRVQTVDTLADLKTLDSPAPVIVKGSTGGWFYYDEETSPAYADDVLIVAAEAIGSGCFLRMYQHNQYSLEWFGGHHRSTSQLLEQYGRDEATVFINAELDGGWFTFKAGKSGDHDGVNNINGWLRVTVLPDQVALPAQFELVEVEPFAGNTIHIGTQKVLSVFVDGRQLNPSAYTLDEEAELITLEIQVGTDNQVVLMVEGGS